MKERIIGLLTALAMLSTASAAFAAAPDLVQPDELGVEESAGEASLADALTCGELTYEVVDGTVTITDCYEYARKVDIPEQIDGMSVTSIGDKAFYNCSDLKSITIPDSVTSIGDEEFYGCFDLTNINVDSNNKNYCSVDGNLFDKNKTVLIRYAMGKTDATYSIPDSVSFVGTRAFAHCSNLKSITIPNSVSSIRDEAFDCCSNLKSITIPNSVSSIGDRAFYSCDNLTGITIPNSVYSIGTRTFGGCKSLTSIAIPDSISSINDYVFDGCHNLKSITIPNSVSSIGYMAFSMCYSLKSITIPNSVSSIGARAFHYCSGLTSITIPDSISSIGDEVFYHCDSLTSVTIPDSVSSISNYAFWGCPDITDVYYSGSKDQWKAIKIGLYNIELTSAAIHYNSGHTTVEPSDYNAGDTFTPYYVNLSYPKKYYMFVDDTSLPGTPSTQKSEYSKELYEWAKEYGYDSIITKEKAVEIIDKYMPTVAYSDDSTALTADQYSTYDIMRDIIMLNSTLKSLNQWEDEYLKNADVIDLTKTSKQVKKIVSEYTDYLDSVERNPIATAIYTIYSQKLINTAGKDVYKITKSYFTDDIKGVLNEGGIDKLYNEMKEFNAAWKDSGIASISGIPENLFEEIKSKSAKKIGKSVFESLLSDIAEQNQSVGILKDAVSTSKSYASSCLKSTSLIAKYAPQTLFEVQLLKLGKKVFETIDEVKSSQYFMINYYFKHNSPDIYDKVVDADGKIIDYMDWIMLINGSYDSTGFAKSLMSNWYKSNSNVVSDEDRLSLITMADTATEIQNMDINSLRKNVLEYWANKTLENDTSDGIYQIQYTFNSKESFEIINSQNEVLGAYTPNDGYTAYEKQSEIPISTYSRAINTNDDNSFTVTTDGENGSVCVVTLYNDLKIKSHTQSCPLIVTVVKNDGSVFSSAYVNNSSDTTITYSVENDNIAAIGSDNSILTAAATYENVQSVLDSDTENLKIGYSNGENANHVCSNITLDSKGLYGSDITWQSSTEDIISSDGKVVRDTQPQRVVMTAVISNGDIQRTKTFELTVASNQITVSFDTCGGTEIENQVITVGEPVNTDITTYKAGSTFDGWYLDEFYEQAYEGQSLAENAILYAKWNVAPDTLSITADAGYYAQAIDSEEKEGIIAFNAFFDMYKVYANQITQYGIYIYKTGDEANKVSLPASSVDELMSAEGKFYATVNNIPTGKFETNVVGMPYIIINGNVVTGEPCVYNVLKGNKWLGIKPVN